MTYPNQTQLRAQADQPRGTNVLALISIITGVLGFAIIPVILGHLALGQIRRTGEGGQALAIVGLVLGYLAIVGYTILIIAVAAGGLALWGSQ